MIGQRIREARKNQNLTIKELADSADVTAGYISQIERDLIDPSLSVLRRISKSLSLPLATFFSEESDSSVVITKRDKRTRIKFGDINIEYEFMTPSMMAKDITPKMEVIHFKLAPKSWSSNEVMLHNADECTIVFKGQLEYHINGEVYVLNEGDSIYIPENTPHLLFNPTDEILEAYGIISPAVY